MSTRELKPAMDELMSVIHETLQHPRSPRLGVQLDIEQSILDFNPDLNEATEFLDSIIAALGQRYPSDRLVVVEEEAKALRIAMNEAEPCEITKDDMKADDSRWFDED